MKKIERPPTISGMAKAWLVDLPEVYRRRKFDPSEDATTLAIWLVEAPWAHPAWHSYSIVLVHLRPFGSPPKPTIFHLEGATHEIWVIALNPRIDREQWLDDQDLQLVDGELISAWLRPNNFSGQFIAGSDEEALAKVRQAVADICAGKLSPDTDHIRSWMHRFGDHMIKAEHRATAGETRIILGDGQQIVVPPQPGPQDKH